ncbi:MAG TPA: radical SAM family heme chaperone HemW [Gemmatimonadales bacterium]
MHVYIHVPFCARRCSYCDFAIAVRRSTPDSTFLAAIVQEIQLRRHVEHWPDEPAATVYFGGGTPSRLDPPTIELLIDAVRGVWPLAANAEVTLETNPDDVTADRVAGWLQAGVNRISLGVQSHNPAVLEWMHRTHRADQVPDAVAALRSAGVTNISADLIFALPPELERDWNDDLERTLALEPQHISLYGLTVEPHTPLARWTARREVIATSDERYAAEYVTAHEQLATSGYEHYEVSNASRAGFRSRHNAAYWSGAWYVGLGPAAHSLLGQRRQWNLREWEAFRLRVSAGGSPVDGFEEIDRPARELERRYLGLRTIDGLPEAMLPKGTVQGWIDAGWASRIGDRIRLTVEGWLRLDALVGGAGDS